MAEKGLEGTAAIINLESCMLKNIVTKFVQFAWHDPVLSKVISTGIVAIIGIYLTVFYVTWADIFFYLNKLYNLVFGKVQIYNWLLCFISCVSLLYLRVKVKSYVNINKIPEWEKIKFVEFQGIKWRWKNIAYEKVKDIRSFCPICDFELYSNEDYAYGKGTKTVYFCLNCNKVIKEIKLSENDLIGVVAKHIQWLHRKSMNKK